VGSVLEAASLVVAVALWWLGIRKFEVSSTYKTVLSVIELGLLLATVIGLRWEGLLIFTSANAVGLLIASVRMAMRHETIIVGISNRTGATKEEVAALLKRLGRREELKWVGPIDRAEWVREIADRGRSIDEIECIAPEIGALSLVYDRPDPTWLIRSFDRILRLYGMGAPQAHEAAETIHASIRASAASFDEMMEAFISFHDPPADVEQAGS